MSGEIRIKPFTTVENYINRLLSNQVVNTVVTTVKLGKELGENAGEALLGGLRGVSNNVNEIWKGLPNKGFGGFQDGGWAPSTKLEDGLIPNSPFTPKQIQTGVNNGAKKAIELSMTALGKDIGSSLPSLLSQYANPTSNELSTNSTTTKDGAGFSFLGLNMSDIYNATSPLLGDVLGEAAQQTQRLLQGVAGISDSTQPSTAGSWVIVDDMYKGTVSKTQDMQELFGTEGRFESAFDLSKMKKGATGTQLDFSNENFEYPPGKLLTLEEQKTLAAYALYSAPKFYIPPMLVVNDEKDFQQLGGQGSGTDSLKCFIFLSVGNLVISDATYPRNVPILKIPDADIDAVQDLGFGSGTIKVSGVLWNEAGYARLQTLRELCKTRRPLIWSAQETGAWLVFPQNVPGLNTTASAPGQYTFELTLICVGKLTDNNTVRAINKQRALSVERKYKQELAILVSGENQFKLFSSKMNSASNILMGYVWDPGVGDYKQAAAGGEALKDLSLGEIIPDPDFKTKTTGTGSGITTDDTSSKLKDRSKAKSIQELMDDPFISTKSLGGQPAPGDKIVPENDRHSPANVLARMRKATDYVPNPVPAPSPDRPPLPDWQREWLDYELNKLEEWTGDKNQFTPKPKPMSESEAKFIKMIEDGRPEWLRRMGGDLNVFATTPEHDLIKTPETIWLFIDLAYFFGDNRGIKEASPSEIYYWISATDELLSDVDNHFSLPDYAAFEGTVELNKILLKELNIRGLPIRDASRQPGAIVVNSAYAKSYNTKNLLEYYDSNVDMAIKNNLALSLPERRARFSVGVENNAPPSKLSPSPSSSENYKTTTNNNTWVTKKTKIIRRADQ